MDKRIIFIILAICLNGFASEQKAYFAGGCFWCMESVFKPLRGVTGVTSGFARESVKNTLSSPTYYEVASGKTDFIEAVEVFYDSTQINYDTLLEYYWMSINPTDDAGQFSDRGNHYRPVIFFMNEDQKQMAMASKEKLQNSKVFVGKVIKVTIQPFGQFFKAGEEHQNYFINNKPKYQQYYEGSGRGPFIKTIWNEENKKKFQKKENEKQKEKKQMSSRELKEKLDPLQYHVTQENGTEAPFKNAYWDNKKEGIYVDVVTGEPLFSSKDKFDSGSGWPAFTRPIKKEKIFEKVDGSHGMSRTEVRSSGGHLGHVFNDGPIDKGGLRYCINSAAMRFIPKEKLIEEGYPEYLSQFE